MLVYTVGLTRMVLKGLLKNTSFFDWKVQESLSFIVFSFLALVSLCKLCGFEAFLEELKESKNCEF